MRYELQSSCEHQQVLTAKLGTSATAEPVQYYHSTLLLLMQESTVKTILFRPGDFFWAGVGR